MPIVALTGGRWEEPPKTPEKPELDDSTFAGFLATNALAHDLERRFAGDPGLASSHQPEEPGEL